MAKIHFSEEDKEFEVPEGTRLLDLRQEHSDFPIYFGCCSGTCGVCAVEVTEGKEQLSRCDRTERETLHRVWPQSRTSDSVRLCCRFSIFNDVKLNPLYRPYVEPTTES